MIIHKLKQMAMEIKQIWLMGDWALAAPVDLLIQIKMAS